MRLAYCPQLQHCNGFRQDLGLDNENTEQQLLEVPNGQISWSVPSSGLCAVGAASLLLFECLKLVRTTLGKKLGKLHVIKLAWKSITTDIPRGSKLYIIAFVAQFKSVSVASIAAADSDLTSQLSLA